MNTSSLVSDTLAKMSVQDKVGQCFVIGFTGSVVTPAILERIRTIRPAGVRMGMNFRIKSAYYDPYAVGDKFAHRALRAPTGTVKDFLPGLPPPYLTCGEYADFLNRLKKVAVENPAGIPLHITYDMEGDISADFPRSPMRFFPSAKGLAQTGDPTLASSVGWAVGAQMGALGCSWIHWPILDVNTDPLNPEIGTRSFGDNPDTVIEYGMKVYEGLKKSGTIATAKHFPGRGHSIGDAHHGLPTVELDREALEEHIRPFRALIDVGVPSIMTAHTTYPALDPSGDPASLSKVIITDFLKGELGFEGVVTSDDITMGAILEQYEVHEAVIKAINAGTDLILLRDESALVDEVYAKVVEAVEAGLISEERLNDAAARVLKVKADYGLFDNGAQVDAAVADQPARSSEVVEIARQAAARTTSVLRDPDGLLPLKPETRVLLVEQANTLHINVNSQECHPGILWEAMLSHSENVPMVEVKMSYEAADHQRILNRMDEADVVVMTNTYYRRGANGHEFVKKFCQACSKPVIVVTNTDLPLSLDDSFGTVVLSYGSSPECIREVANHLYGKTTG